MNTDPGFKDGKAGAPEAWPNNQFQTLPVVAVIALLTKIQVDVRNAETDVITELYNEIDKRSFKFNRLVPTVLPVTSTYVMVGGEFEASVFFAAVDTTQKPKVMVGEYTINGTNPDGSPKYEMVGNNYQTLDYDESGKGVFKARAVSIGPQSFKGLITMNAPDGSVISRPFKGDYEVGAQNVVISPTAMNKLYRGIKNPIAVSVPGVGENKIRVEMTFGTISKGKTQDSKGVDFPGTYVAEPDYAPKPISNSAQIIVSAEINGKQVKFKPMDFRVADIPPPIGEFAGVSGQGPVSYGDLQAQGGVRAVLKDFDFSLEYKVTRFRLSYEDKGLFKSSDSPSNILTAEQKALLKGLTRGKRLYVENIFAIGPDKKEKPLGPITITVN